MKTFYVTTPIYYANRFPHLGHLYTMIVADCVHRYKEQRGIETYFLTGTDEHGINIERAAERNGRSPQEQADHVVSYFTRMTSAFGLDAEHGGYDIFMRTTYPFHAEGVSHFWRQVAKSKTPKGRDAIYKGHYEGWFCAPCAAYKTEDEYVKPKQEGSPPLCLIHETPLDRISEESYFFRLSDYDEALLELYETRPDFIRPESRRNEVISFVRGGLQDLSVSRLRSSVDWGIPVPDDPAHTIYVWFDALTNYITAIGYGNEERQRAVGFEKFWPALHLVGKDILRFHAVFWPAFVMAAGVEQPLGIIAHGMWVDQDGRKMSKTLGNIVELDVLQRHFSIDAIRYFCLREMVFGQDGRFGYETLIDRTNSDLANGLGNLSSRTLTMIARYCDGRIPSGKISEDKLLLAKRVGFDTDETTVSGFVESMRDQFLLHFDNFAFSRALETAWAIIERTDRMITETKPWDLAKDENHRQTLHALLYRAAESLRWLTVLLHPIMPEATRRIYWQLGLSDSPGQVNPANLKWGDLPEGTGIGDVEPVFPRHDKGKIMREIKDESAPSGTHATEADAVPGAPGVAGTTPAPPMQGATEADAVAVSTKSSSDRAAVSASSDRAPVSTASSSDRVPSEGLIDITDFAKVELRAGEVLTAERIPKADKLLLLTVDIGEPKPRQILAGIAEHYEPNQMIGRKIAVVANLKPRKLRGYESQGMLLAASVGDDGRPVIATFTEEVPNGARLK
ncbi:MAG TPA: methionine--tRNA ligase [Pyrinomonadaceae bacterium]|nr:methionine--tRNA ligase [Pyrinomonadaceae bacterium]